MMYALVNDTSLLYTFKTWTEVLDLNNNQCSISYLEAIT